MSENTGGWSSEYYELPKDAKELDDLIVQKEMHWHIANIFKACYRFGSKDGTTKEYDLDKIIWFAQKHKEYLSKQGGTQLFWHNGYAYTPNEYAQIMREEHGETKGS